MQSKYNIACQRLMLENDEQQRQDEGVDEKLKELEEIRFKYEEEQDRMR